MVVTALADMGGEIYSMELDLYGKKIISPSLEPTELKFDIAYINKRLGLDLKEKDVKQFLEKMGFGYLKGKALIPSYRSDILHQIDLAEDIAIAYGYENFEAVIPKVSTVGEESKHSIFNRKIAELLTGLGLTECKTYHITNKDFQTKLMNATLEPIELANALNAEYNVLTAWIIPSLMDILKNNKHHEYPQNIFDIGRIFKKDSSKETGIIEQERLACLLCSEDADYTRIKQILDYLLRMIGVDYKIDPVDHPSFIEGRVGRLTVKGKKLAFIGELAPNVLENWDIDIPVAAFELNLTELLELI
jgi:phenylalanyl-tRNA synthetase beta chain